MHSMIYGTLAGLACQRNAKSRAVTAENPKGEKGRGGMAASNLGPARKGSPCLRDIEPGKTVILADIDGPGIISHIWITLDSKTSDEIGRAHV